MHKIYLFFIFVLLSSGLFSQTLIAGWDFQTTTNGGTATAVSPNTPTQYTANVGAGIMYLNGMNGSSTWSQSTELTAFDGTNLNTGTTGLSTVTTSPAALAPLGGTSNSANGKFITFTFSMSGLKDLVVSYATRGTSTGFTTQNWEYSTNGTTWSAATTISAITTTFTVRTLSTITGLDNAGTAYLRLTLTGASAANGNNRLDNIQLNATSTTTTNPTINLVTTGFNGAFGNVNVGSSSTSSSFIVSGSNLSNNIVVTPPTGGFEIRTGTNAFSTAPIVLTQVSGSVASTTIDARFTPSSTGVQSGNITASSTGATDRTVAVSGTGVAVVSPTKLAITSISPANPTVNTAFNVTIQAQDASNTPQNVVAATSVTLAVSTGTGTLGGTITGTISAGSNQVVITGATYNTAETGVVLTASRTAGDALASGNSAPFNVIGVASQLAFVGFPTTGTANSNVATFTVEARRADNSVDANYTGSITLSIASGTGNITGTLTRAAVAGIATFNDIKFDAAGSYTLSAASSGLTSGTSSSITISAAPAQPTMTELVVPQYIASKTSTTSNSSRVPFAFCLSFNNLLANTTYKLSVGLALSSDAATSYGAGSIASGNSFSGVQALNNAFTTNASGGSGPVWIQYEATANDSRFGGGQVHYLRASVYTGSAPGTPQFIGTKTITALDIASTPTVATSDDGAFLKGQTSTAFSGKYILTYDNEAASGNPLSVYQVRTATATSTATNTASLPTAIADVFTQSGTSAVGDFAVVFPIGANNANGLRRIEIRNADNTIFNAFTTADGVWNTTNNTTTIARRAVQTINVLSGPLNNLVVNNSFSLTSSLSVSNSLILNNGILTSTTANPLRLATTATVSGGSNTSYVNGPVIGATNSTSATILPIGKAGIYKPVTITPTTATASEYTAEYFATTTPDAPLESRLNAIQTNEYWVVDRTAGTSPAKVTLDYNSTGATWSNGMNPSVSDVISIVHLRSGNNTWTQEYGTTVPNSTNTASLTTGTISDFSPFTFGYGPTSVLPVVITSFTGTKTLNVNVLNWKVATETNFKEYVLERSSTSNGTFKTVTTVAATQAGSYNTTDAQPAGYNYYRLKLIDRDGKISFSKIVLVINETKGFAITNVYPTVTTGTVLIDSYAATPVKATIRVVNQAGQSVYTQTVMLAQAGITNVNLSLLAKGNYLMQVLADGYSKTVKLVKQ